MNRNLIEDSQALLDLPSHAPAPSRRTALQAALGVGYVRDEGIARQLAYFFGHKWELSPRWGFDWGFRGEKYRVKGFNQTGSQNARGNWDPTYGGADKDPFTMADNRFTVAVSDAAGRKADAAIAPTITSLAGLALASSVATPTAPTAAVSRPPDSRRLDATA